MNKFAVLLSVAALVAVASASPFTQCGSPKGTISKLVIEGCDDSAKQCILKKGTDAKLSMTFKSQVDAAKVQVKAYGVVAGIPVPYPLPESDACAAGVPCPLAKGVEATYSQAFNVRTSFPSMSLKVKWTLLDESKNLLACAMIPVKIE